MRAENKRAKALLNWESKISFEDGLIKTINWFKNFIELYYGNTGLKTL